MTRVPWIRLFQSVLLETEYGLVTPESAPQIEVYRDGDVFTFRNTKNGLEARCHVTNARDWREEPKPATGTGAGKK